MPDPSGWFFDSVTLSNFALSGAVRLVRDRYRSRGFVTTQVVDELTRGVAAGYAALSDCLAPVDRGSWRVVTLNKAERSTFRQLVSHLGEGEAGTLAAAYHRHGVAVTDDLAARRTCDDMGIPVTGTIGILRAIVRDRVLSLADAHDVLRRMIDAGFRSPMDRLTDR